MSIQDVLREMREYAKVVDYDPDVGDWVTAIEALMREPVAWRTDDYLTDKSATTYKPEIARHWVRKGWGVDPLYEVPPDAQSEIKTLREAVTKMLACPAIADADHADPEWGCAETREAEAFARAVLAGTEDKS